MTYQRFEDLPVWQEAARLFEQTDDFLEIAPRRARASFRDQLERAVVSVSNNIAEGFERGTTNELLCFLYAARRGEGAPGFFSWSGAPGLRISTPRFPLFKWLAENVAGR